ncbi:MAG TPA: hypothetical protein VHB77_03205 [Planctomycetaceae bacterium]|nr:hypothetical protein [Planctomycetaceae bacterium]
MAKGVNRIGGATGPGTTSAPVEVDRVGAVWQALLHCFQPHGVAAPRIERGHDGHSRLLWEKGEHRLEFVSDPGEPSPFFYANSQTGWMWEAEWHPAAPIPPKVQEALRSCGAIEPKFASPGQLLRLLGQQR